MPWGAAIGAGIGLIGDSMKSNSNGGAGTQTNSKDPWAAAQPWLMSNIVQGQNLQGQYAAQPFSPQQTAAYGNQYGLSDYERSLVPSLLGQLSRQPLGFDPNNPNAKSQAFDWTGGGLLGANGTPNLNQSSVLGAKPPPTAAAAPAAQPASSFVDQGNNQFTANRTADNPMGVTMGVGGYGSFKYGDPIPAKGTQKYYDYQQYLAYGGADPANLYNGGVSNMWGIYGGGGGNSGSSVGGSPAGDGSGGGGPGVF
ncbi:hypothetical protein [Variovorax sp. PBL-E5]|uniref:hypothetical protein n=1 Tax=Variovorax sp. PBL-E5 TaxID=434014 RepID=UPI0013168A15|nr:hypothetical protein [Variovorax sp. PBL-E5]VTU37003.1 hypothetical protein E5CHR_04459 [Variovorax sp. PBL-E5]